MQLGMIGLGRMGANIVRWLMRHQHLCVVFDGDPKAVQAIAREGAIGEYGLTAAYAEGFEILQAAGLEERHEGERFPLDLANIAEVWRHGSVISSWLLDLTAGALASDPRLDGFEGYVAESGEGRWTVLTAAESAVPATVLSAALYRRFRSRQERAFADRMLSAMRKGFGGHVEQHEQV